MAADIIVTFTDTDETELAAAIQVIRDKFAQAQAISGADAKKLYKLGEKSMGFVTLSGTAAHDHPDAMADNTKPAAHDAIKASYNTVAAWSNQFEELSEMVTGLQTRIGAQWMAKGLATYESLKRVQKDQPEVAPLVEQLGERFKQTKAAKADAPAKA